MKLRQLFNQDYASQLPTADALMRSVDQRTFICKTGLSWAAFRWLVVEVSNARSKGGGANATLKRSLMY